MDESYRSIGDSPDYRALCEELADKLAACWPSTFDPPDCLQRARAALAAATDGLAVPESREPASVAWEPSDEELLATLDKATADFPPRHPKAESLNAVEYPLALELRKARAVLARFCRPAPVPAEGEVGYAKDVRRMCDIILGNTFGNEELDSLALLVGHHADVLNAAPPVEGEVVDEARYLAKELRDQADDLSPSLELFGLIHRAADLLSIAYATGPEVWEPIPLLPAQRHPTPVPVSERLPGPGDCDAEGRCWLHLPDMGTEPLWRLTDPSMRSRYHSHWLPATALPLPQGEVE